MEASSRSRQERAERGGVADAVSELPSGEGTGTPVGVNTALECVIVPADTGLVVEPKCRRAG